MMGPDRVRHDESRETGRVAGFGNRVADCLLPTSFTLNRVSGLIATAMDE